MVAPNEYRKRVEEIKSLIAGDHISQAVARLMDFVRDFSADKDCEHEVTILSANFNRVEKAERTQRIAFSEATIERNKVLFAAMALIDEIESSLSQRVAA